MTTTDQNRGTRILEQDIHSIPCVQSSRNMLGAGERPHLHRLSPYIHVEREQTIGSIALVGRDGTFRQAAPTWCRPNGVALRMIRPRSLRWNG